MTAKQQQDPVLMPLRPDLEIFPGPAEPDGSPTYSIFDPLTGNYHKIGWAETTILRLLNRSWKLDELVEHINSTTTLEVTREDIAGLYNSALHGELTIDSSIKKVKQLTDQIERRKVHPAHWLLMHYLYFRVPIIYPEKFLNRTVGTIKKLLSLPMIFFYGLCWLLGLYFLTLNSDAYFATFPHFFNIQGIFAYSVTVICLKAIHEFSHAYFATALGARVRSMGVAFMVFWPLPFCDVTDAWRLKSRRDRALIGLAGIIAELTVGGIALFLWRAAPDGIFKSVCFLLSSATLVSTLIVNLNPAMRFDGYYILTDIWGIDNLRPRAFALTKWWLYKKILGVDNPPPEEGVPPRRMAGLIVYSIYSWNYRIGLYLGIAVLVYYKFEKALGIILFLTEIGVFLVRPIYMEIKYMIATRNKFKNNRRFHITCAILGSLLLWQGLPLPRRLAIPAITVPQVVQLIFSPGQGRIDNLTVHRDSSIERGERLFTIQNEELEKQIEIQQLQVKIIQQQINSLGNNESARALLPELEEELAKAKAELSELSQMQRINQVHSSIDGRAFDWDMTLQNGSYIQAHQLVGRVAREEVGDIPAKVVAYVPEGNVPDLEVGQSVMFMPDSTGQRLSAKISAIQPLREQSLRYLSLASSVRGNIPVAPDRNGNLRMVNIYYRVDIELVDQSQYPRLGQKGNLWFWSRPSSNIATLFNNVYRLLLSESTF